MAAVIIDDAEFGAKITCAVGVYPPLNLTALFTYLFATAALASDDVNKDVPTCKEK